MFFGATEDFFRAHRMGLFVSRFPRRPDRAHDRKRALALGADTGV